MGRYNFTSTGAAAAGGIERFLLERELERRQRMEDDLRQQQEARAQKQMELQAEDRKQAMEDRRINQKQVADDRRQNQANLEEERSFRRATTMATIGLPGILVGPGASPGGEDTAQELDRHGYGTLLTRTGGGAQEFLGTDAAGQNQYSEAAPGIVQFQGGTNYQNRVEAEKARADLARQTALARAEAAREQQQAAAERQQDRLDAQAAQAAQGRSIQQQGVDIRRDAETRAQATADEKKTEKAATTARQKEAALGSAQDTLDLIDRLIDVDPKTGEGVALKPGVGAQFGYGLPNVAQSMLPGFITGDAADRRADVNQLRSRAIVNLLNELKSQSRTGATGFGALTAPELKILENGATILSDPNISNDAALQAMARMRKPLAKLLAATQAPAAGGDDALLDELLQQGR